MKKFSITMVLSTMLVLAIFGCSNTNENNTKFDSHSLRIAKRLMGAGSSFNAGPINGPNHEGLAEIITKTKKDFDSKNGEVDAHNANPENRDKFFAELFQKIVDKDSGYEVIDGILNDDSMNLVKISEILESEFGKAIHSDYDGICDTIDPDDDGDGIWDEDNDNNERVLFIGSLMGGGPTFEYGYIAGPGREELDKIITKIETKHGITEENKKQLSHEKIEVFLNDLLGEIKSDPRFSVNSEHQKTMSHILGKWYRFTPDTDSDGIMDVVDDDDDADKISDVLDDDDDNDGCMDWDEADGNVGGEGQETKDMMTGKGRGEGIGDEYPPEDKSDPGDTSENDKEKPVIIAD